LCPCTQRPILVLFYHCAITDRPVRVWSTKEFGSGGEGAGCTEVGDAPFPTAAGIFLASGLEVF
jgi:hypothetical protein